MRDLADQFEDLDIIKQLNWGITHISNNIVYDPIIEGKKIEAFGWLYQSQQQQQISQELKCSMSSDIQLSDESLLPEQLKQDFERNISNLDYVQFSLFQKYASSILTYLTFFTIQFESLSLYKEQLFSSLRISPDSFQKCVDRLAQSYRKENLYHNIMYTFDVTHTEIRKLSKLDYSILLLSISAHDVDHLGLNNIFILNIQDELAMTYNDYLFFSSYNKIEVNQNMQI